MSQSTPTNTTVIVVIFPVNDLRPVLGKKREKGKQKGAVEENFMCLIL